MRAAAFLALAALLAACAPRLMAVGDAAYEPGIETAMPAKAVMADGARLPLLVFAAEKPHAVVVALHGFNDYSNAFAEPGPGPWLAERGVTVYAPDQRGFGRAPGRGLWAGDRRMAEDAAALVRLVRARHPGLPVYLLGVSMGGAVAMRTMTLDEPPEIDGLILAAPAVWGWQKLNRFYAATLWTAAHLAPAVKLTGRGLDIWPSDNIEMMRALGRDPLVIKETQIGTLYGLVGLMDSAYDAAPKIGAPVLLLYGAKDEIVPAGSVAGAYEEMEEANVDVTAACYPGGYHMLLRDLEREVVWRDVAFWIENREKGLPSGYGGSLRRCGSLAKGR